MDAAWPFALEKTWYEYYLVGDLSVGMIGLGETGREASVRMLEFY